jgi:DNA-binding IclR family transcriptional regulator
MGDDTPRGALDTGLGAEPAYKVLTAEDMDLEVGKRMPLLPTAMSLILAALDIATKDKLLQLMALSSSAIQTGLDMGISHDLYMQLMESGWAVLSREDAG